jgi:hypothetical protein
MMPRGPVKSTLLVFALTLVACQKMPQDSGSGGGVRAKIDAEKSAKRAPVLGELRLSGLVQDLRASPDGHVLTVLVDAHKPGIEGAPPTMRLGELWAMGATTGAPVKIAADVTNMPGGWLVSPDSRWILAAAHYDQTQQAGELVVADTKNLSAEKTRVSGHVAYFVPSDDGLQLAWVENGVLSVGPLPNGPWRQLAGEVSTAEFSADGRFLYFRRRYAAAGGLYQVNLADTRAQPRRLLDQVAEYTVLRSNRHVVANARQTPADRVFQLHVVDVNTLATRKLADDALRFRVSRDGRFLAWRTASIKGEQADVGELWVAAIPDGKARKVGGVVKDFEFSPDNRRLVFRDNYLELPLGGREARPGDGKVEKVGDLSLVELPDGAPRLLQRRCPNFLFSPDGATLAYTARIESPEVTRRLLLLRPGQKDPVTLKEWLYEYQFRPPGNALYFRADCMREGRSCDVLSVPVNGTAEVTPKVEMQGVYGIKFSADGTRAIVGFAHLTDETFDVAVRSLDTGTQTMIDQFIEWPALLLGEKGDAVAYLSHEKKRSGVYVAKSP